MGLGPGFLNDKSLLGEHRELHGLFSIHVNNKKGYARHPETMRWTQALSGLYLRHELLVSEMQLRGFNHKSPLETGRLTRETACKDAVWPEIFIDSPGEQFSLLQDKYRDKPPGRIPLPGTTAELWASHKYSVMARDTERYRTIGPRVAKKELSFSDLSLSLVGILRLPPPSGRLINALEHMWGYVSDMSSLCRRDLGPEALLDEIRSQARVGEKDYLLRSTALGELGVWVRALKNKFTV